MKKNSAILSSITVVILLAVMGVAVLSVQKSQDIRGRAAKPEIEANLVGYWRFDENSGNAAIDSSGKNNHGLLENGASRFVGAQQGNKLELDGVDDRVKIQTTDSVNNLQNFTLTAVIRPTKPAGIIVRKGNSAGARFNFGIDFQGKLYLRVGYDQKQGVWQTNESVPLNAWAHVGATYSFSSVNNKPELFIGGVKKDITEIQKPAGNVASDTPYMYIGNNHDLVNRAEPGYSSGFKGRMDLIKVYNRIMSASEVDDIFKNP